MISRIIIGAIIGLALSICVIAAIVKADTIISTPHVQSISVTNHNIPKSLTTDEIKDIWRSVKTVLVSNQSKQKVAAVHTEVHKKLNVLIPTVKPRTRIIEPVLKIPVITGKNRTALVWDKLGVHRVDNLLVYQGASYSIPVTPLPIENSVPPVFSGTTNNLAPPINSVQGLIGRNVEIKEQETRYSPFNAVQLAFIDAVLAAQLFDLDVDPFFLRYVSLHNYTTRSKRLQVKAAVDFVVNHLNPDILRIKRTAAFPSNDDPIVIRVNLRDYGIDPNDWDRLVELGSGPVPLPEPYFHQLVQEVKIVDFSEPVTVEEPEVLPQWFEHPAPNTTYYAGGYYQGKYYKAGYYTPYQPARTVTNKISKTKQVKNQVLVSNPLLALDQAPDSPGTAIAALTQITNTKNPIVRADWFITYATWAPRYYELIGLRLKPDPKDVTKRVFLEEDFERLVGADLILAKKDVTAAIADSKIVALHNRILQRFNTVFGLTGGYYWRSKDTDSGIDAEDYLNNIANFLNPVIKAQEIIASGRNGLHFFALTDANRIILDKAVADIAVHGDTMPTKLRDKQVWTARNCMMCHAGGQILPSDHVRRIAQKKIALLIADQTKDFSVRKAIEDAFYHDLKQVIDLDNAKFQASVLAACGLDANSIASIVENIIYEYYYSPITIDEMALEIGCTTERLQVILKRGINMDYTLTAVLQEPPVEVYRLAWERAGYTALTQEVLRSIAQAY